MGRRGPRPANDRIRLLKGLPPRLLLTYPHPPATEPDVSWIDSEKSPLGWLPRKAPFEPTRVGRRGGNRTRNPTRGCERG